MPTYLFACGMDNHIGTHRCGAGCRCAGLALDFTNAQSARPKGSEMVGDTEAWNLNSSLLRRPINGIGLVGIDNSSVDRDLHGRHDFCISLLENSGPKCSIAVITG